jgi:hypothetical protein
MVDLYRTATEYLANQITITRGTAADIVAVGVYHTSDPTYVPEEADFIPAQLVEPGDPLAQGDMIDIVSLVGPASPAGAGHIELAAGEHQRWVMIKTASEVIIRKVDVVEVT